MPRMPFLAEEGQEISLVLDWWHADERLAEASNTLLQPDAICCVTRNVGTEACR